MRLGTRGSQLALAQANTCARLLEQSADGVKVEIVVIHTEGDKKSEISLSAAGGVGLFTKALEEALLHGEIDAAVHSLKDLPTQMATGLSLGAVSIREDWRDAWLSRVDFRSLPQGAVVGTGSPRRRAQLALLRPDLKFVEFRGNIDTRLKKLEEGVVQGAVLAAAGLSRIGRLAEVRSFFGESEMLPAPGQGFLGLQARTEDKSALKTLSALENSSARACSDAERGFLDRLGAGCHAPVAALAQAKGPALHLCGFTQNSDGRVFLGNLEGDLSDGWGLGGRLAERLIQQGAELTR